MCFFFFCPRHTTCPWKESIVLDNAVTVVWFWIYQYGCARSQNVESEACLHIGPSDGKIVPFFVHIISSVW